MTWKLFYCYFSSYKYKNRIWHLWNFFLKIIFPSYIYNICFVYIALTLSKKIPSLNYRNSLPRNFSLKIISKIITITNYKKNNFQILDGQPPHLHHHQPTHVAKKTKKAQPHAKIQRPTSGGGGGMLHLSRWSAKVWIKYIFNRLLLRKGNA